MLKDKRLCEQGIHYNNGPDCILYKTPLIRPSCQLALPMVQIVKGDLCSVCIAQILIILVVHGCHIFIAMATNVNLSTVNYLLLEIAQLSQSIIKGKWCFSSSCKSAWICARWK